MCTIAQINRVFDPDSSGLRAKIDLKLRQKSVKLTWKSDLEATLASFTAPGPTCHRENSQGLLRQSAAKLPDHHKKEFLPD